MSYEMIARALKNAGIISSPMNPLIRTVAGTAPVRSAGPGGNSTPQLIRIRGSPGCSP